MPCVRCLLMSLVIVWLGTAMQVKAGVTVIQNVAPSATSWPGSPTIITMPNPSSATVGQTFTNSGSQAAVAITNSGSSYQLPPLNVVTFIGQASPPTLTATRQGDSLVLSWPTNANGFRLEYSTSVSGGTWAPFPAAPVLQGNNFMVTSGLGNEAGFFRLRKP